MVCPVMKAPASEAKHHRDALEVLGAADAIERRLARHPVAHHLHQALGHLGGEEAGRDRVHVDVVLRPLRGEGAREADDPALRGVVADRAGTAGIAAADHPQHGRDVDDPAAAARHHAAAADFLGCHEHRGEVEVDHLLPRLERVVEHVRAPCRAGVVDQDVDRPEAARGLLDHRRDGRGIRHVAHERQRFDAQGLQVRARLLQLVALARGERHPRAHLAQRLGHLEAQPAGAARDEGRPPGKVEQFAHAHRPSLAVMGLSSVGPA